MGAPGPSSPDHEADLALALELATAASALALEHHARRPPTWRKDDGSVVTEADVAVERFLVAALAEARPDDRVLGEELGAGGTGRRRWIIDPIDGTRNFVAGRPDWGVHLALEDAGAVVVGVVTRPVTGIWWFASKGGGAFRAPLGTTAGAVRLAVSDRASLAVSRLSAWWAHPAEISPAVRGLAGWVDSVDLDSIVQVAEGTLDVMIDHSPSRIWDRAPHVVLVEEAGGRYRDHLGGRDLDLGGGVFTNGLVDDELDRLRAAP